MSKGGALVLLGVYALVTPAVAQQQFDGPPWVYFRQDWCPSDEEADLLADHLSLTRNGCCVLLGIPRSQDGVPAGALQPWREKISSRLDKSECRGAVGPALPEAQARIDGLKARRAAEIAEKRLAAARLIAELERSQAEFERQHVADLPGKLRTASVPRLCRAFGQSTRDGPAEDAAIARREIARRGIKLDDKLTASQKIRLGVSECQLYASFGVANHINRSVGGWGVDAQHVFGDGLYVYTRNGVVTSYQD